MAKIKVEFSREGEVKIDVEGVVGNECEKMTKNLEDKLGKVVSRKKKPEYYNRRRKNENKSSY